MTTQTFQAVIFDMDGLIVDTENIYYRTYNETLNDYGADIPRKAYVGCVGHPVETNSADAVAQYNLSITPEQFLNTWMHRFEAAIADPEQIDLMPGFLDLLSHVRQRKYRLGIASSTPRHRMQTTLRNGVLPRIPNARSLDDVFSAQFSGSDVARTKPDPEIYLKTAGALGVAPGACVVFEDSAAGVQSAKTAGMTVFAVPNFFTAHQDHAGADRILTNLAEAIALL